MADGAVQERGAVRLGRPLRWVIIVLNMVYMYNIDDRGRAISDLFCKCYAINATFQMLINYF